MTGSTAVRAETDETVELAGQEYLIVAVSRELWSERSRGFNESARRNGVIERVQNCEGVIDVPIGTVTGNHSYGAICSRSDDGSGSSMLVCNDMLAGHFSAQPIMQRPTRREIAEFVGKNCFGG